MKKTGKNQVKIQKPLIFIAIGYEEIYDDFDTVNPLSLIAGIPTVAIVKFVAEKFSKVFYAQSDIITQRQSIRDFIPYLPAEIKQRVWRFIRRTEAAGNCALLFCALGCQMVYQLALQNNVPLEDEYWDLCEEEVEPVFKTLLYCNSKWTNEQKNKEVCSLGDLSLKMDILIAENKQYKDFRAQLYKASQFYNFCERDKTFKTYLPYFLKDKGVDNWEEYLTLLFGIYYYSIKSSVLPRGNEKENKFLSQFVINQHDGSTSRLWDDGVSGINFFRDHFLYELPNKEYLLLDANRLIDKFYQSLKFELYDTITRYGLQTSKGKPYGDRPQFNSTFGDVFSEKHLLYGLLDKTYDGANVVKFSGEELKKNGIDAELDYYLRIGNALFLIEFKDVLFNDSLKYTGSAEEIRKEILKKLCKDDGVEDKKGGGQLLFNLNRILNQDLMNGLDPGVSNVTYIYPLLITTDMAYSALGVNLAVMEEFDRIRESNYCFDKNVFISNPVIVNVDSLILLSYRLHETILKLNELLNDYISGNWLNIGSFDNFVVDKFQEAQKDRSEGLVYLLGDTVAQVAQRTAWMQDGIR